MGKGQGESAREWGRWEEKRMDLGCNCPGNWVVRGRWKTGTAGREISRKTIRVYETANEEIGGKVKLSREMLRGEEKGKREPGRSICQGKSAVFQAQCLCAIWITAGFSCPRLFYIKLRQLLDFPHYCHGIGLIQCPSMFSPSPASIRRDLLSQVTGHLPPSAHCYGGH